MNSLSSVSSDLSEQFWRLIDESNWRYRIYVYRLSGNEMVKPPIYKGHLFPDIVEWLRDNHYGGEFAILVRRGATMILSGSIAIAQRLQPS